MSKKYPISPPASYVTPSAIGFADASGDLALVAADEPMPVTLVRTASSEPLEGSTSESIVAGPFEPAGDIPIHLLLQGEWSGTVELLRSVDGGVTLDALTAGGLPWARFSANANEVVWQESERGATFYLGVTLASGTLGYRVSQ